METEHNFQGELLKKFGTDEWEIHSFGSQGEDLPIRIAIPMEALSEWDVLRWPKHILVALQQILAKLVDMDISATKSFSFNLKTEKGVMVNRSDYCLLVVDTGYVASQRPYQRGEDGTYRLLVDDSDKKSMSALHSIDCVGVHMSGGSSEYWHVTIHRLPAGFAVIRSYTGNPLDEDHLGKYARCLGRQM